MSMIEFFSEPAWTQVALTLVHFVWQGLVLAILLAVIVAACRIRSTRARYGVFLVGLLTMAVCPVATFFVLGMSDDRTAIRESPPSNHEGGGSWENERVVDMQPALLTGTAARKSRAMQAEDASPTGISPATTGDRFTQASSPWIVILWASGVVVLSFRLLVAFADLIRLRCSSAPLATGLVPRIDEICAFLRMRRPRVTVSSHVRFAAVAGFLRPYVLLPVSWLTQLPPDMLEAVVAHELAHIRRHDVWVNLFQFVLETLFFYHPAVWWLSRRLRTEREMCCDELAILATGQPDVYATTLESAARIKAGVGPLLAADFTTGDNKMIVLNRVRNVLGLERNTQSVGRWTAGLLALSVLTSICVAAEWRNEKAWKTQVQNRPLTIGDGEQSSFNSLVTVGKASGSVAAEENKQADPLPAESDFRSGKARYYRRDLKTTVEFDITQEDWKSFRSALLPAKRDPAPNKWESAGSVKIVKKNGRSFHVELYAPSKGVGAFAAGKTFKQRIYYRGGNYTALIRALNIAHDKSQKKIGVSLMLSKVSAVKGPHDTLFRCDVTIDNHTGKEIPVTSNFHSAFDGLELVITNVDGKVLRQQHYTAHQSPFSIDGTRFDLKRGKTNRRIVFPVRSFGVIGQTLQVRLVGFLPGSSYQRILSTDTIKTVIGK